MQLCDVLRAHAARWPGMRPVDGVKLLYQHSFGGGHLIPDREKMQARLEEEYAVTPADGSLPLFEPLGNHWARLHLGRAKAEGLGPGLVGRMFYAGAQREAAGPLQGLEELRALAKEGVFAAFGPGELEEYLAGYNGEMVSHSPEYRAAHSPAYRVVDARLEAILPLLVKIEAERPRRVAMDGRSASGKTTAADLIARMYGYSLVHMDDFYLPFEMRTEQRLAEPGGNLHYERFEEEVLKPLARGEDFEYGIFDCSRGQVLTRRPVKGSGPVLVEGAYSQRPAFGSPYDLTVFYDIDPESQIKRVAARNGEEAARRYKEIWIPLENRYHDACKTKERADMVLEEA